MIQNTFCHFPGISTTMERELWSDGITSWADLRQRPHPRLTPARLKSLDGRITQSLDRLQSADPVYFAGLLASREHWRLLREFRHAIAYLDIETTGLGGPGDHITTIALYDGRRMSAAANSRLTRLHFPTSIIQPERLPAPTASQPGMSDSRRKSGG